jgi:RHS repeat-associated protein
VVQTSSYNNADQLTGVTYPDSSTQAYTYDNVGNRQTKVEGTTTSYIYDLADRMTTAGGVTYTYDNNGNQTGRGADVFGWDIEDRLTSATVGGNPVSYSYRGDDLRHSKTQAGVTTVYTWDLAAELPVVLQEGNTSYVYGLGLISQTTGTTTSYPLADGLGSTAALTDASGAVTATYTYDVFGAVKSSTGPGSTEFRFAGQQDDPALGYQYLRARYYDPSIGRFISKDPFSGTLVDPQSQTAYPYSHSNPVNFRDPTGLCTCSPKVSGIARLLGPGDFFRAAGYSVRGEFRKAWDVAVNLESIAEASASGTAKQIAAYAKATMRTGGALAVKLLPVVGQIALTVDGVCSAPDAADAVAKWPVVQKFSGWVRSSMASMPLGPYVPLTRTPN